MERRSCLWRIIYSGCLILTGCLLIGSTELNAQLANNQLAHSHNDYLQAEPFLLAYRYGFGWIEADIFLVGRDLKVAHAREEILEDRNLEDLYLRPLDSCIRSHNGQVYPDPQRSLILLIDPKTDGVSTLRQLIRQLQHYPELTRCPSLKIVITGNQPPKTELADYPDYIWFDGDLDYSYDERNLARIVLFSANFRKYSSWKATASIKPAESKNLEKAILHARQQGKPVRFWNAPDNPLAWKTLLKMGVGLVNTDKIAALSTFLNAAGQNR